LLSSPPLNEGEGGLSLLFPFVNPVYNVHT
jgi:hypothetical protein